MAKTLEAVLKEQIGAMAFQIAAQSIEIETLQERISHLESRISSENPPSSPFDKGGKRGIPERATNNEIRDTNHE